MAAPTLKLYIDYKSPYAYLAKDPAYRLETETGAAIDWLPYVLDIPAYLGSAKVDGEGRVVEQNRNAHQWRRVKYSYMDVRREANRVGLTILGTQKIWDSSLAGIGLLYAKRHGVFRAYNDEVYERFWKRDLDIESTGALADVLKRAGADVTSWEAFASGEGQAELKAVQEAAEAQGVFGVPSFLFPGGDLYWGREHLPRIREIISEAQNG
ncbi:MAG TPA: DsbA family protein [Reyranella sp.]|jgi:2-hydroxychromene-2-carboxylate isomerase|nr:DsbA family protein [Reyranella sp.]